MKKTLLVALMMVAGGAQAGTDYSDVSKQQNWIWKGQEVVRTKLKDGDSAKFRNVYFNVGNLGKGQTIPVSCGEVNSKNGFGAYGGFQRFVSAGSREGTVLEEQVADFQNLWNMMCKKSG